MTIRDRGDTVPDAKYIGHLWDSSNTLLSSAPTISAHLAGALRCAVDEERISRLVQKLHCPNCHALLTFARVRVRKAKHRTRRGSNPGKNVVRTCAACKKTSSIVAEHRKDACQKKEVEHIDIAKTGKDLKKERRGKSLDRPKKRAKRARKESKERAGARRASLPDLQNLQQQPSGLLANSFLFQPLD